MFSKSLIISHTDNIILKFNNKIFTYYHIQNFLSKNIHKIEFLPGIYIKKTFLFFLTGKIKIFIKNKKDDIEIKKNNICVYTNIIRSKTFYEYNTKEIFDFVETNKIDYPIRSGGGGSRCIMKDIFFTLCLYDFGEYNLFTEHEMFESSSQFSYLNNMCKEFSNCKYLYKKMYNHTYKISDKKKWDNDITLVKYKDRYQIVNANHRVCVAKRFNIQKVYAKIYIPEYENKNNEYNNEYNDFIYINSGNNKDILNDFYKIMKNLNINNKQAHFILKKGLKDVELIKYIEKINNKSLLDLYKEKINYS